MSEQLDERVTDVLNEADAASGSALSRGDDSDADDESATRGLLEIADEASEILESAEPGELLEAVGLDTLPDGTEPESIPEAIARGDAEQVEDLRRLLNLAKLTDSADEGTLQGAVGDLRARIDERERDGATADRIEAETAAGDSDGSEPESTDTDSETTESGEKADETGPLEERLRSAMRSTFEEFGDDVRQLQERLEEATAGDTDDEPTADESEAADAAGEDEDDEETEDEGLLEPDLGSNQDRGTISGGATRHSTMAPPPSRRADMKGVARFSTMPDKQRD
ncbi:hypothetical protein [Halopiger djelfimassiliensis]|uniref:hypothetical protein n=1 Tax=Halopiger djelfimassiliensis TaxID=1293047 RepID=UPI000677E7F0|nr:hypothetical protein [Halopiger djelfimassiliensis]